MTSNCSNLVHGMTLRCRRRDLVLGLKGQGYRVNMDFESYTPNITVKNALIDPITLTLQLEWISIHKPCRSGIVENNFAM